MRLLACLIFFFLLLPQGKAQDARPKIIGQKELSTDQGVAITIKLTDLQVEEAHDDEDRDDDSGNSGQGSGGSSGSGDDENNGERDEEEDDREDKGDDSDDDKEDKKNKKNDKKGDDKNKNKGNENDKGKGNNGNRELTYPNGYELKIQSGPNYSVSGTTVIPEPSFTGEITAPVQVANDSYTSPKYDLKIRVRPVNQPPVITGHVPLKTQMGTALTIELSYLHVSDPDNAYPEGFSLLLSPGENYKLNKAAVTPANGFSGDLIVPAMVNDGKTNSEPFNIRIMVTPPSVANVAPVITGQLPIKIQPSQNVDLSLSHLLVTDPDNEYPKDHTLKAFPGKDYTLAGTTVIPSANFLGVLTVGVTVHDGTNESPIYPLKVTVSKPTNQAPVITGQSELKIVEGQSLELQFSHLVVDDRDNKYPDDFTLKVFDGQNYSVSANTIIPDRGFIGTFRAKVTVDDGQQASPAYNLEVDVVPGNRFEIVGQKPLEMPEDSSVLVTTQHLIVNDPSNNYPSGFTLKLGDGENYVVSNNVVRPARDFSGILSIPVTVSREGGVSSSFSLLISVITVNDAPELAILNPEPVSVTGAGPWQIFPSVNVIDVDDHHLLFAEIAFDGQGYHQGIDKLEYDPSDSVHAVFDHENGVLFLVGRATLRHYEQLIRSVRYTYINNDSLSLMHDKRLYASLNDGKDTSPSYEQVLMFEADIALDIPSAFTPNNDNANDTWKIVPLKHTDGLSTSIRVFDKRGNIVFESSALEHEWDGLFNGSPLPADVYFYTIEMQLSNKRVNYKGIVSILR